MIYWLVSFGFVFSPAVRKKRTVCSSADAQSFSCSFSTTMEYSNLAPSALIVAMPRGVEALASFLRLPFT